FEQAVAAGGDPRQVANWMINNLFSLMNEHKQAIEQVQVQPDTLVALLQLVADQTINQNTAKDVLAEMFSGGHSAATIVATRGLAQISDESALAGIVAQILAQNEDQVAVYRAGKTRIRGWFVGQVMQATGG